MKCPKCSWDNVTEIIGTQYHHHTESPRYRQCWNCGLVFTDHQQSEIESLRAELSTLKLGNERLRSGLEHLGGKKSGKCLGCGATKTYYGHDYWFINHAEDCQISALLKGDSND